MATIKHPMTPGGRHGRVVAALALALALAPAAPPAHAQQEAPDREATVPETAGDAAPRCSLLGQTATTAFLNLAGGLGRSDAQEVGTAAALLDAVTATYDRIGCARDPLAGVFDCILQETTPGTAQETARACLIEAGLAAQ